MKKLESEGHNIYIKDNYDNKCSVCLLNFTHDSDITITICNHIFDKECITEWSRYKKECPICRNELKK